ncbi:2Fe-2S ferredoxin-like [Zophobas morio]|uniref:2Fe-2S ferredoxin-like n=1 Tax=Zophobas morio TaxID=2755281 RepID=UPI003083007E
MEWHCLATPPCRRDFSVSPLVLKENEKVTVIFETEDDEVKITGDVGETVLDVAQKNNIDLEGACEGSLACSTCHVVVNKDFFHKIPPPLEEEVDMLDLAYGLEETSRLGCQICLTKELEGVRLKLPKNYFSNK